MILAGVVFVFGGQWLTELFTGGANPDTANQAATLLRVAALAMPFLAIAMITNGALRGAGDTRWPMVINLIGMLGVRIAGAYLVLGPLINWAGSLSSNREDGILIAIWFVMVADLVVRSTLVAARFFQGGWTETKV